MTGQPDSEPRQHAAEHVTRAADQAPMKQDAPECTTLDGSPRLGGE